MRDIDIAEAIQLRQRDELHGVRVRIENPDKAALELAMLTSSRVEVVSDVVPLYSWDIGDLPFASMVLGRMLFVEFV
jgi:hypothetical protein